MVSATKPKVRKPARAAAKASEQAIDGRHARRLRTEARMHEALGEILQQEGPAGLGVNAVADRAGVEKVLIYRYFGSLEGLMQAYAERSDFWPSLTEILGEGNALAHEPDRARAAAKILGNYARALRKRPVTLDLLGWECAHRNPLTVALETLREQRSQELFAALTAAGFPLSGDVAFLSALLSAAINYLAVRSRDIAVFAGLPVRGDQAWQQMESVFEAAFRPLLGTHSST